MTNDGGPAFPGIQGQEGYGNSTRASCDDIPGWVVHNQGMTLRDWFAGQALGSVIECCQRGYILGCGTDVIASTAYEFADAMLKAREAKP